MIDAQQGLIQRAKALLSRSRPCFIRYCVNNNAHFLERILCIRSRFIHAEYRKEQRLGSKTPRVSRHDSRAADKCLCFDGRHHNRGIFLTHTEGGTHDVIVDYDITDHGDPYASHFIERQMQGLGAQVMTPRETFRVTQ